MRLRSFILILLLVHIQVLFAENVDSLFFNAVLNYDFERMTYFAKLGANVNMSQDNAPGFTILHQYACYGNLAGVDWCVKNGCDVNAKDLNGLTPLMYATYNQHTLCCKILVDNGADIFYETPNGINVAKMAQSLDNPLLQAYYQNPRKNKIPEDYNNVRRHAILSVKQNDFKSAHNSLSLSIKKINKDLGCRNKFRYLLPLDLARIYNTKGETGKMRDLVIQTYDSARKYIDDTEMFYRVAAERAAVYLVENKTDSAVEILLDCLQHREMFHDYETMFYVQLYFGICMFQYWRLADAENFYWEAREISKTMDFLDHELYGDNYISANLALIEVLCAQGTANSLHLANSLQNDIASLCENRHDYVSAQYAFMKGQLYYTQGDYFLAEDWYRRAEYDWYHSRGTSSDDYANIISSLADISYCCYNIADAIQYYKIALGYRIQHNTNETLAGAIAYAGLARAMVMSNVLGEQQYDYSEIDDHFYHAINLIYSIKGRENLEFLAVVNNLCWSLWMQKDTVDLPQFHKVPVDLARKSISRENIYYLNMLTSSIQYSAWIGDVEYADSLMIEYDSIAKNLAIDHLLVLPEEQREYYWNHNFGMTYESILPNYIFNNISRVPEFASLSYNNSLFSKGILLKTTNAITRELLNSSDTTLVNLYYHLLESKVKYQQLLSPSIKGSVSEERHQLYKEILDLEEYITHKSRNYVDFTQLSNLDWKNVRDNLSPDQVAIEFSNFTLELSDSKYVDQYVASIVTSDCSIPYYLPLFTEEEIEPFIEDVNKDNLVSFSANGQKLQSLIWTKILPLLSNKKEIIFSPSGTLVQLPIEHLPLDENLCMSDQYLMTRCSSTSIICNSHRENKATSAVLYGGITYDVSPLDMIWGNAIPEKLNRCIDDTLLRGNFSYLNGSLEEVSSISLIMEESGVRCKRLSNTIATEKSFKSLSSNSPQIIHVATHGFYWPSHEAIRKDYIINHYASEIKPIDSVYIDPLNRCGLLFAGANLAMSGNSSELPDNVEDGILTAKEISLLDLGRTDLVILSACETGLGDLDGDGVYGLQRAFKLAGVKTLVMSLWKVNDEATQLLMTTFYKNWISLNMSKRDAFDSAKRTVRSHYPEPTYWAGFIMLD